jgi:hypothetical protein
MLKVNIDENMIARAKERAKAIPQSRNTFMPFDRHVAGFAGEEMIIKSFDGFVETKGDQVYNYDFLFNNKKIEVKTKLVTSEPKPHYECSTYTYFNQQTEYLVFNRVFNADKSSKYSWPYGWILGWITYDKFHEIKNLIPKGQMQSNGFETRTSTWNIFISDLNPIETLIEELLKE